MVPVMANLIILRMLLSILRIISMSSMSSIIEFKYLVNLYLPPTTQPGHGLIQRQITGLIQVLQVAFQWMMQSVLSL